MALSKCVSKKKNLLINHPRWAERLREEYDHEANGAAGIALEELTAGSQKRVAWVCKACGYKWTAKVLDRTHGNDCAACSNRVVVRGLNDLASVNTRLAKQWHPTKNGESTPQDVVAGSARKVWWLCPTCGHEWQAQIASRNNGVGCPACSSKVVTNANCLATTHPRLAKQWHPSKNCDLTPKDVTAGSHRDVWWLCPDCGYEYHAMIVSRKKGDGCPACANKVTLPGKDLCSTHPKLAAQWHPDKNGKLTSRDITSGSGRKVWWLCPICGYEWQAVVAKRAHSNQGCPACAGHVVVIGYNDLATTKPELAAQWHPTKNDELKPTNVSKGTNKKVWWLCPVCGHDWEAKIVNRVGGSGCPKCAAFHNSHGEDNVVLWADSMGFFVHEQWKHGGCRDKRDLPFDAVLYLATSASEMMEVCHVEYDGEQHSNPDTFFSSQGGKRGRGYDYVVRHDAMKNAFCSSTHRLLIRVPYTVKGVEAIGEYITDALVDAGMGWVFDVLEAQQPVAQTA